MRLPKMLIVAASAVPLLLGGCGGNSDATVDTKATDAAGKKVTSTLAIDTDGFKANLEIPGLQFAGKHMDINGIKLYPGSTIRGMHIAANDKSGKGKHNVAFDFVSPGTMTEVIEHLTKQAEDAGYSVMRAPDNNGAAVIEGRKTGHDVDSFRFVLKPSGTSTAGTATVEGTDG